MCPIFIEGIPLSEDLEEVREAIKKKGARWRAEKTSVSELSVEEMKKRLGSLLTDEEIEKIEKIQKREKKECPE